LNKKYTRANKELQQATLKILQERKDTRTAQDRTQTLLAQAAFIADDAALSASVVWNGARESTNEPQTREQQLEAEVQRLKTQLAAATPSDSSRATKSLGAHPQVLSLRALPVQCCTKVQTLTQKAPPSSSAEALRCRWATRGSARRLLTNLSGY
jgi:hypothetical protein